jgi:hypothetical protein
VVHDALGDDFAQHFSARVLVEKYGHGSVTAGDPPLGGLHLRRSPVEYVVIDPGIPPRIVAEERGIRFLLHVAPDDLRRVPTRKVALLPTPASAVPYDAAAVGVELLPGAAVRVLSRQGTWAELMLDDPALEARGWVPDDALGFVYVPVPATTPTGNVAVHAGAAVLDRPRGTAIARATRSVLAATGPARDGFVPVEIERPVTGRPTELCLRARGFVAAGDLRTDAMEEVEVQGDVFERSGSPHQRSIAAGVRLHATLGGELVGITLPDARAYEVSRNGPWLELTFDTAWGELTVWAEM